MIYLTNKVALVTGGTRGIGKAISLFLAKAGATVVANYYANVAAAKALEAEMKEFGGSILTVQADVSNPTELKWLFDKAVERYGRLDILVNNAALSPMPKNHFEMESYSDFQETWQAFMKTNLDSAANATYLAVQQMRKNPIASGGKIINIASRSAYRGETEYIAYAAAKAAMVNLTVCSARSLAKFNIVSSCVAPGFTVTDMAKEILDADGDAIRSQIPLGRVASPEDVAGAVLFLASDMANYLNGTTIDVNGGSYFH
jgi:3-oxoacyl-[acyl-carrier protein] reductase